MLHECPGDKTRLQARCILSAVLARPAKLTPEVAATQLEAALFAYYADAAVPGNGVLAGAGGGRQHGHTKVGMGVSGGQLGFIL